MNALHQGAIEVERIAILLAALTAADVSLPASQDFDALITPFVEAHCVKCHGEKKQKGDIRLDILDRDFSKGENAILWQDVSDMLITGDMPPEEEARPPMGDVSQIIKAIDTELRSAAASINERGRIAIRRLSHSALDNTVKDLLGIDLLLSHNLPADPDLE